MTMHGALRPAAAVRTTMPGLLVAGATALVSGVSVFVNSYGVKAVAQPAVYTTAKNLVAALLLATGLAVVRARRGAARRLPAAVLPAGAAAAGVGPRRLGVLGWAGLAYIGAVGGGAAFVLFFSGLKSAGAEPAAFLHDTLVVWVAVLALPFLRERVSRWNVAAVVLLVAGQVAVTGGVGVLVVGRGQAMVLAATMLWAGETVVAKRLIDTVGPGLLGVTRMGAGVVVLVGYVAVTGHLSSLVGLDARQLGWVLATGALLALYVSTWMVALSRARAVDVTSVLVASVLVTSLLGAVSGRGGLAPQAVGLALVTVGAAAVVRTWPRRVVAA